MKWRNLRLAADRSYDHESSRATSGGSVQRAMGSQVSGHFDWALKQQRYFDTRYIVWRYFVSDFLNSHIHTHPLFQYSKVLAASLTKEITEA